MKGKIKRLHSDKGFGFIREDTGREFFFHRSAVLNARFEDLEEGQLVDFEEGIGAKGPRAEDVRVG